MGLDCISPLAVASLLVNDEIAQPAHEVSFCGVPMRGTPLAGPVLAGGKAVSGREAPYLRVRWT